MLPENRTVEDVLKWSPQKVLDWVQLHLEAIDRCEDWQTLAYGCRLEVTVSGGQSDEDIDVWACAGVLIYDCLGRVCTNPADRSQATESEMSLRAFMVDRFGPQSGHTARDPAVLEDWFFRRLSLSFEDALAMSKNSISLSTDDFLRVSSLKDRVRLMKSIRSQQMFRRIDELNKWYGLLGTSPV
jgi:hypothetical protein